MLRPVALVLLVLTSIPLTAATFTVTSGADSGPGTLRQAILDANALAGRDQIVLAADVTITSSLPAITDPIDISGAKSPGRYRIDAGVLLPGITRLDFAAGSDGSTVRSIFFGAFEAAIRIAASDVVVTDVIADQSRVDVAGDDNVIGGTTPGDGNDIDFLNVAGDRTGIFGNTIANLSLAGADDTTIGAGGDGFNDIGIATIHESRSPHLFNNALDSLFISQFVTAGPGPRIIENVIESGGTAVMLHFLTSGTIANNIIRGTTGIGIINSIGVNITGNEILATDGLPIDLDFDGPTPNDPAPDADTGANSRQNFPVLTSATATSEGFVVSGTLTSAPLTPYRIQLFTSDAANPDAQTYVAQLDVTTDATGNVAFTQTIALPPRDVVTATATSRALATVPGNTRFSTSELSAPVAIAFPGSIAFQSATQPAGEAAGTVTITVTRGGGSDGTVTVDYATSDGTAVAPGDYTAASGTLTFADGVTSQTIVVPVVDDALPEADETFTVTLTNPTGGATIGPAATTTVTILDNDPAVAAAPVPTASAWALIAMILGLTIVALRHWR